MDEANCKDSWGECAFCGGEDVEGVMGREEKVGRAIRHGGYWREGVWWLAESSWTIG